MTGDFALGCVLGWFLGHATVFFAETIARFVKRRREAIERDLYDEREW